MYTYTTTGGWEGKKKERNTAEAYVTVYLSNKYYPRHTPLPKNILPYIPDKHNHNVTRLTTQANTHIHTYQKHPTT